MFQSNKLLRNGFRFRSCMVFSNPSFNFLIRLYSQKIKTSKTYDFIVIGGGSGGIAAARKAASLGAKVLLVEANYKKLGGTCVNSGCIPKKLMWYASDIVSKIEMVKDYGFLNFKDHVTHNDFNWEMLKNKITQYTCKLNTMYEKIVIKEKIDLIYGYANFINSNGDIQVSLSHNQSFQELKQGQVLNFSGNFILVTSGSVPKIGNVVGKELGITSDDFFKLKTQPKSVAIIGSGYIGVELSGILKSLGTDVNIILRKNCLLSHFDESIQTIVTEHYLKNIGMNIIKNCKSITKIIESNDKKKEIHLYNGVIVKVDEVIWAIGRNPKNNINLDLVGVKCDPIGNIIVDKNHMTSNKKIFSLGDVVGKKNLTPVAIFFGRKLASFLFDKNPTSQDYNLDYVPSVVFSNPQVGSIGLTTSEAKKKYGEENIKIYESKFTPLCFSIIDETKKKANSYIKMITQGQDEKIVGLHILDPSSAEILQGFSVCINMGITKKCFENSFSIHPTLAEEVLTLN